MNFILVVIRSITYSPIGINSGVGGMWSTLLLGIDSIQILSIQSL
jgi:hypothetical protein